MKLKKLLCLIITFAIVLMFAPNVVSAIPIPNGFDPVFLEYGAFVRSPDGNLLHPPRNTFFVDGRDGGAQREAYLRFELSDYIERILAGEEFRLQLRILGVSRYYPAGAYILPPHLAEFDYMSISYDIVNIRKPPSNTSMRNDFSRLAVTFTPTQSGALLTDDFVLAVREFLLAYPDETGITLRISSLCRDSGQTTDGSAIFSFTGMSRLPGEPVLLIGSDPSPPEPCDDCGEYDCDGDCDVEPPPEPCDDCGEYDCDGDCEDVPLPPNALQITPSPVNFGTIEHGRPNPGAIPITITNTGDTELKLLPLPQVPGFTFGNLPNPVLQPEQSRTVSVNVNANLPVGTHNTTATITTIEGASATVELRFTVTAPQNNNNNNNNQGSWNNNRPSGNVFTRSSMSSNNNTANNNSQMPVERTFTDVSPNDWFAPYVSQAVSSGLLNGVGNGEFAPNVATTRAMFVTVLWRLAGSPNGYNGGDFSDVANDSWYSQAIAWAEANGIVSGVGNGYFAPNVEITREQMGLILYRYVGDAVDAVMDRSYVPQNTATRAEMAAVILRLNGR